MKRISLLIISIFFHTYSNAQDTIVKRNGEQLLSKILEISATEVKYKKFDFLEGPDFIDNKSNILLIKYSNGSKEVFEAQPIFNATKVLESNTDYYAGPVNPTSKIEFVGTRFQYKGKRINEQELHQILLRSNDQQIPLLVKSAKHSKKLQSLGFIGLAVGAEGLGIWMLGSFDPGGGPAFAIAGGVCVAAAIPLVYSPFYYKKKRNGYNGEAIRLYNAKY